MRNFISFLAIQAALVQTMAIAVCPTPIPPLPQLPIPAVVPPPPNTCPGIPTPDIVSGYLPFTFVNNSGLAASEIYICTLVNSSTQYLSFSPDGSGHMLATITNFTPTTYISSPTYSYPLSSFQNIGTNQYTFYIPNDGNTGVAGSNVMKSSRILVSLKQPMTYFINNQGLLQMPTDVDATNDNYYILNDKIEFDLGSNALNRLNLNLTGVDFFGLPFLVEANYQFFYGSSYTPNCAVTGYPTDVSFTDIFSGYATALSSLSSPFAGYWQSLAATYTNPDSTVCNLRIFAPATAMGSTQKQSNPSQVTFPTNYFLSSAMTNPECTWFNAVWRGQTQVKNEAFYQPRDGTPYLVMDATTDAGAATATGFEQSDGSFRFSIAGGPDAGKVLVFPYPTSSKAFFTGAVSDYQPAITSNASAATQAQVFKVFATSIISGLFPLNCQYPNPITINNSYVQSKSAGYFENNALLNQWLADCSCGSNIPWYDYYSRTLLTIGTPNLFYTSAYSDFLGADGTIVIVNPNTNNSAATITVSLNDVSTGVNFPNPYSDSTVYTITVNPPANDQGSLATVQYGASASGPWVAVPSTAPGNAFFLKVQYTAGVYNGQSFITQIAPLAKLFHPILPGQGVIITTGTSTTVNIGAGP